MITHYRNTMIQYAVNYLFKHGVVINQYQKFNLITRMESLGDTSLIELYLTITLDLPHLYQQCRYRPYGINKQIVNLIRLNRPDLASI